MLLVKLGVILCMLLGLLGTFIHLVPGTPVIFLAAFIYDIISGFSAVNPAWLAVLLVLTLTAELGSRSLRRWLTADTGIGKVFGLDVAAGSFASLIMTDVLAGPVLGLIIWELLMGKSLMPLIKRSGMLVLKLCAAAIFRFFVAIVMIVIIIFKML